MKLFLICLCLIGFGRGENQTDAINTSTITNTTTSISPPANQEQFEVISLNSYSVDNPLIIRSRIPESLKPSQQDIQSAKSLPAAENIPQTQSHDSSPQFSLPLPYFNREQPGILQSRIEVLPTVSIPSISDLSPLLYPDSPYAVGLTSFESSIPYSSYYPLSIEPSFLSQPIQEPAPLLPLLTPAELQFSTSWNPAQVTPKKLANSPNIAATQSTHQDFTIEKVPEVASFSKSGQFSTSDIPALRELETIFSNASAEVATTASRIKEEGAPVTLTSKAEEDLGDATTVQPQTEFPATLKEIKSNEIESGEDDIHQDGLSEKLREQESQKGDDNVQGNVSIWDLIDGRNQTETTTDNNETTTVLEDIK